MKVVYRRPEGVPLQEAPPIYLSFFGGFEAESIEDIERVIEDLEEELIHFYFLKKHKLI